MNLYHVEMTSYRLVGWGCLLAFGTGTVAAFLADQSRPALGLALFACGGLYVVLGAGSFDITNDHITHTSTFGIWRIRWDEISSAEFGRTDGTLVLKGVDKRFVLSPPEWWGGPDKTAARDFVVEQLRARHLTPLPTAGAAYKTMKNTRVR